MFLRSASSALPIVDCLTKKMDFLANLSIAGWVSITFISTLIFLLLMIRGIRLGWGDKSISIGKKLENKIDAFKKDIEIEAMKKSHDEAKQKSLFKKCNELDSTLFASLHKVIKKMDGDVYKVFEPYVHCQFPSLAIVDIFEDVLIERIYFNNLKVKLTSENIKEYLNSIVDDIKANYLLFYMHLKALHCGEGYPEWDVIKDDVEKLVISWAKKSMHFYIECISQKIELYRKNSKKFETEEFKRIAVMLPLKKNKRYLEELNKSINSL